MPRPLRSLRKRGTGSIPGGQIFEPEFVSPADRARLIDWLGTLWPIWENRFVEGHPEQRRLLRPVYWLGNWQFACLDYYRPPNGVRDRCVQAEPFPEVLEQLARRIESRVHQTFESEDVPRGWHLNTCLVNYYGANNGVDTARVGEHRDHEPGPVASLSFGERALFQFVRSSRPGARDEVVSQTWLTDRSLQVFGGERWKRQLFHRVQRVDEREGHLFPLHVPGFSARRVNLTLRYVPDEHVVPFARLRADAREHVRGYVARLAEHSAFWRAALESA